MSRIFGSSQPGRDEAALKQAQADQVRQDRDYGAEARKHGFKSGSAYIDFLKQQRVGSKRMTSGVPSVDPDQAEVDSMAWHPAVLLDYVSNLMKGVNDGMSNGN